MKALSIHQPWCNAILHQGKAVENRTWPTNYRGPLLIHAAKSRASYDRWSGFTGWRDAYGCDLPPWDSLAKGAIVGVVDLVQCAMSAGPIWMPEDDLKWVEGPYCWFLRNPRAFAEPIPYRGAQSLFEIPDAVVQAAMMPSAVA